jgi:hypothetical protein
MNTTHFFDPSVSQQDRQTPTILVVMGQEEHTWTDSPGQRFVTALKNAPVLSPTSARSTAIVTAVAVGKGETDAGFDAVAEDLQDLLAHTAQVLIVPWLPEDATDRLLDTVKGALREPVYEQQVLRPTLTVKGAPSFGPWGNPVNPQQQLDRYVRLYPGWHHMHTLFTTATRRVVVLRSRATGTPPIKMEAWHETALQAYHLLLAGVRDSTIPFSEQVRRDGAIYLDYLCSIAVHTSRSLNEKSLSS